MQAFRTRQETTRVAIMRDVHGNKRVIRQQGKLGLAKSASILSALERRALWFSNRGHPPKDHDKVLYT